MTAPAPHDAPNESPAVSQIELLLVSIPFSAGRRVTSEESIDEYNASSQTLTEMQSLMVRVTDTEGRIGWGEAFGHKTNPASWAALEQIVGPFFLGRDAEPAAVMPAAEYAFHAFGRTGPVHYALSAIDIALWDLKAQRTGAPLRRVLAAEWGGPGSAARNEVGCYASLVHYGEDPVEVAHHISRAQEAGYRSFKLHESTPAAVAAAREQAGPEAGLMTDVNCHWDEAGAERALRAFEPFDLLWLEEPIFPPDDTAALARLNALSRANSKHGRISAGENASGTLGLIEQMRAGALAYAQPSVGKIGGITGMLEVLRAGRELGVAVVPHCFYYGPALNASAELTALLGDEVQLEVPFLQWSQHLHPLHGAGPEITLPETPGLGFHPDEKVLGNHLVRSAILQ